MAEVGIGLPDALAVDAGGVAGVQAGGGIGGASAPPRYLDYPPNLDIRDALPVHLQIAASPPLFKAGGEGWPSWAPVEPCQPEFKVYHCLCRARVAEVGCNRLECRRCETFLRKRRADAIEQRIEANRHGRPVIYTILTVPPDRRKVAADVKTWGRWLRSIRKVLKKKFGLLFGVERVDPAGDEHPDLWHPHLNLLWVQRDGFRPFIDVDELREEWGRIVQAPAVDVWTQYSTELPRLRHWYSYMGRTWPNWRNAVPKHLTVRWIGKHVPRPEIERDINCPKCGAPVEELSFGTLEAAETMCRAGPERCREEIRARRRNAYAASQSSFGRLTA